MAECRKRDIQDKESERETRVKIRAKRDVNVTRTASLRHQVLSRGNMWIIVVKHGQGHGL